MRVETEIGVHALDSGNVGNDVITMMQSLLLQAPSIGQSVEYSLAVVAVRRHVLLLLVLDELVGALH